MNKNFFLGLVILGLFLPLVSGLETQVISVSNCTDINVELVSAELRVDDGEYSFKDCSQNNSLWICTCNGDYNLILLTNITTLNTYDFRINYTTIYTTESTKKRSSGGSWKPTNISIPNTTPYLNTTYNLTYIINTTNNKSMLESPRNNTNPIPIYQPPTQTKPPVTTPPTTTPNNTWNGEVDGGKFPTGLVIIVSIIVIISIILFKVLGFNDKPKKPIITEPKPRYNPKWRN